MVSDKIHTRIVQLGNPDVIKKYMFGTTVVSDWKQGSEIVWKGEWKGRPMKTKARLCKSNQSGTWSTRILVHWLAYQIYRKTTTPSQSTHAEEWLYNRNIIARQQ